MPFGCRAHDYRPAPVQKLGTAFLHVHDFVLDPKLIERGRQILRHVFGVARLCLDRIAGAPRWSPTSRTGALERRCVPGYAPPSSAALMPSLISTRTSSITRRTYHASWSQFLLDERITCWVAGSSKGCEG